MCVMVWTLSLEKLGPVDIRWSVTVGVRTLSLEKLGPVDIRWSVIVRVTVEPP